MDLLLKIWRQKNRQDKGGLEDYKVTGISKDSSFLEMLDVLNENSAQEGKEPVAFDHDCREGICGMCSLYINGRVVRLTEGQQLVSFICACLMMVIQFI